MKNTKNMSSSDKIHFSEISFASMNIDNKNVSRILIVFKKSHKCEEGGCAPPQSFCLAFIDELEKQLFIKKLLK